MVKKGGPAINTLADICGHKVAVEKGTTQLDDATAQAKKCSKPDTVLPFAGPERRQPRAVLRPR